MKKADGRRAAILDRLADHVLAHGLIASSLRPLAKAAETSDRMLLYYFADKAEIISATLTVLAARMVNLLNAKASPTPLPLKALLRHLEPALMAAEFWPFMRVWLEIASRAAGGDPIYRAVGEQIGRGFLAWGAAQLESNEPEVDAARFLVSIEGMVLLKAIGLANVGARSLEELAKKASTNR